ncbi:MAG: [2,4-di-O-methyl-alpha-L-fucopyranosyl-(1-_3)-alpha-L-rhamnopyranosyl-(1-_3)-2-O-methyl-alpha-L-rhamnopyranosyl] dimycocerosyl phenol-phthiocerol 3'''-O-methyltransferase, partial [Candidatus Thorarchaeota archaeon]
MSISSFTEEFYQLHNKKRQEHLASLSLPIDGKIILEVGAGIGDHSQFFIDRGCPMVITDAREQNAEEIGERYQSPNVTVFTL